MNLTRTAPRLAPAQVEPGSTPQADGSVADLATRLAQEGMQLAALELRRLGAEVRERRRHVVRAAVSALLGAVTAVIGIAALAGGSVLYLGRLWNDHAAAAAATGALFLLLAVAIGCVAVSALRRVGGASTDEADERSPRNGT
jgi:uncharacterized membrane protein YqjE